MQIDLGSVSAVIFDFDGVLVESVDVKTRAFAELYKDHGSEVMKRVVRYHEQHGGVSRFEKFRYFQTRILGRPALGRQQEAALGDAFSRLVVDEVVAAPMVPGAQDFLDRCLASKTGMFIVSGTPLEELEEIIARRGMSRYFTRVYGTPGSKSGHISSLLGRYDIPPASAVMLGDAWADYEGARDNAVNFIGRVPAGGKSPFPEGVPTIQDLTGLSVEE